MLRRLGVISLIIFAVVAGATLLVDLYNKTEKSKITSQMDNRLASYDYSKGIVLGVPELMSIGNQQDYSSARDKYRKILSEDLWDGYFSSEKYTGGNKTITIRTDKSAGEILGDNDFVFKLDILVGDGVNEIPAKLLVFIRSNIVYKIQSLG